MNTSSCRIRLVPVLTSCCALLVAQELLVAQDKVTLERGWSTVRTDLEVSVDPLQRQLSVSGMLELVLDGQDESMGPTVGVNARSPLLKWTELTCEGATVELGGRHPEREAMRLAQVRFEAPKRRGDRIELRFSCELAKSGRQLVVAETIAIASWVEVWYPIPEPQPGTSLGGATRARGMTTFRMPKGWSAVTNGSLVSHEDEGDQAIEVWSTPRALSRSFALAPFRRITEQTERLTANLYLLSDSANDPDAHVRALGQAIQAMEEHLGPYPFRTFSIAEVPTRVGLFGAASEQGFILVKPHFLAVDGGNLPLFAHEAAHAWWGNTVGSAGSGSLLCTESLAQYGAVLAIEAIEGKAAATEFLRFSRRGYIADQCARGYVDIVRGGKDIPLAKLTSGREPDHTLADSKGHWVFHMLRRRVGDAVFFATLRQLIAEFDGRSMSLENLRETFAAAAPKTGLEQFFSQWLDHTGLPVLAAHCVQDHGTHLEVQQLQSGDPYVLDLDVELRLVGGESLRHSVKIGASKIERFALQLPADAEVEDIVLDPDHALLIWHPDYGPSPDGVANDDPIIAAADRAIYVGDYQVEGRPMTVRVVERDERLGIVVGDDAQEKLLPAGEHRFRSDAGRIRFKVVEGRATGLEFSSDGGRRVRARRL